MSIRTVRPPENLSLFGMPGIFRRWLVRLFGPKIDNETQIRTKWIWDKAHCDAPGFQKSAARDIVKLARQQLKPSQTDDIQSLVEKVQTVAAHVLHGWVFDHKRDQIERNIRDAIHEELEERINAKQRELDQVQDASEDLQPSYAEITADIQKLRDQMAGDSVPYPELEESALPGDHGLKPGWQIRNTEALAQYDADVKRVEEKHRTLLQRIKELEGSPVMLKRERLATIQSHIALMRRCQARIRDRQ
jgi:hypothetical protein